MIIQINRSWSPVVVAMMIRLKFQVSSIYYFNSFPWKTTQIHVFPGQETEILKFHNFPGFP